MSHNSQSIRFHFFSPDLSNRYNRYYFNMIEVALAMAIIAIGISSILVLFPVGLNANKAAIAENNLADVSEYVMGFLRAGHASEWASNSTNFSSGFPTSPSNDPGDGATWTPIANTNLYRAGSNNNILKFEQITQTTSGPVADFSAVIQVWKEADEDFKKQVFCPDLKNPDAPPKSMDSIDIFKNAPIPVQLSPYAKALCLEISWPAEAPYANREKRIYRFEIFNQSFKFNR